MPYASAWSHRTVHVCIIHKAICNCTCSVSCTGGKELDPVEENLGLAETRKTAIPGAYFRQYLPVSNKVRDLLTLNQTPFLPCIYLVLPIQVKYDIVVASYSLEDVPAVKLRRMSLASLWRKTKQFLVRKIVP